MLKCITDFVFFYIVDINPTTQYISHTIFLWASRHIVWEIMRNVALTN